MASRDRARRKKKAKVVLADLFAKPTISPEELYLSGALAVGRNGIYDALHSHLNAPQSELDDCTHSRCTGTCCTSRPRETSKAWWAERTPY
jgi:hypothetical protein